MIHIAKCGNIETVGFDVDEALARCASGAGLEQRGLELDIVEIDSPLDLVDAVKHASHGFPVDLVLCAEDAPGMTGVQIAREVANSLWGTGSGETRFILFASDPALAYESFGLRLDGFMISPVSQEGFVGLAARCLGDLAALHESSHVFKFREGLQRISFSRIVSIETEDHDQIVHLLGRGTRTMRGSSAECFEPLSRDPRFFKAGASCILNLEHVRSFTSKGSFVTFSDGSTASIPTRYRKPLEEALAKAEGKPAFTQVF